MNRNPSITEVKTKFEAMEKELGLFELEIAGVRFWQYLRPSVFTKIQEGVGAYGQGHTGLDKGLGGLIGMGCSAIKSIVRNDAFFGKKSDVLVFCFARRKLRGDGKYWDIITDYVLDDAGFGYQALECFHERGHIKPAKSEGLRYLDNMLGMVQIYKFFERVSLKPKEKKVIGLLEKTIRANFNVSINIEAAIKRELKLRFSYRKVLSKILNRYKPKIVIEVAYEHRINMVLNELCKERGITTIEFQHGATSRYHMAYDFPEGVKLDVFPDYYLSFGDYWNECTRLPLPKERVISVGYPYLEEEARKYKKDERSKRVLFISQGTIAKGLSKLAVEFAENGDYEVAYKLHPGEYARWRKEYPWLLESKVRVIDN